MSARVTSRIPAAPAAELQVITHSPIETQRLGERLAAWLEPGDVLALVGELGSGKTQFVKGLARGLDVREPVHSPTFILANEHRSGKMPLFHVDAYRVASAAEAIGFGLEDYLNDSGVTAIEWAERIGGALPEELFRIEFESAGDEDRRILMRAQGPACAKRLNEFRQNVAGD